MDTKQLAEKINELIQLAMAEGLDSSSIEKMFSEEQLKKHFEREEPNLVKLSTPKTEEMEQLSMENLLIRERD
ncbi:hypothetical protein [Neobacillus citreus]|uniref:Uncharacterized protein n=1 Tax=Neobacillus citreus TaxID=2833578 RepID=A0A942T6H6_9BACI|nr:hypothetical protein [Neobacillus citreus]MCH6265346.1 hypothetical protein [Neobacillus citreus]